MEETKKANGKTIAIAAGVLVILAALFVVVFTQFGPKGVAGAKTIQVQVVFEDKTTKDHTISTSEEFLGQALEQEKLIVASEGAYGKYITGVDGVTADEGKQQWWCITKAGGQVDTGADMTPIADGDKFELTLMTGYDQ